MAKVRFETKQEDLKKIENLLSKTQENAEDAINEYLHTEGKEKIVSSITNFIPVSPRTNKHAKTSKWSQTKNFNLAVQISNARKFYYLYFPLTATGTSQNKSPNDFFTKGVNNVYDEVVEDMLERLKNNLLGGK